MAAPVTPLLAADSLLALGAALWMVLGTGCAALPLVTGINKGHPIVGVIGALLVIPVAALGLGCAGGLPMAVVATLIISVLPKPDRPLLSQAEIEAEARRIRGY